MESLFEALSSPPLRAKGSFGCPLGLIRPPGQVVQGDTVEVGHADQDGQLGFPLARFIVCTGTRADP